MVQIFEAGPSFGSEIGRGLGQIGGALAGQALQGRSQQKRNQQFADAIMKQFGMDVSGYPLEAQQQIANELIKGQQRLGLEREKQQGKRSFYESIFGEGKRQQGGEVSQGFQPLSIEQETMLAIENPPAFTAYSNMKKHHEELAEKEKSKKGLEETLSEMTNTLMEGNLGYTPSRYSAKGRRDVQYFNTLGTQLESIGKDMVSKGVLSAPRFSYLLSNLPTAGKTDAANAGALEAWAKELKLDIPNIEQLKELYGEKPKKSEKSKKIKFDLSNPEHKAKRDQLMKKFNGNREKVKEALDREFEG